MQNFWVGSAVGAVAKCRVTPLANPTYELRPGDTVGGNVGATPVVPELGRRMVALGGARQGTAP